MKFKTSIFCSSFLFFILFFLLEGCSKGESESDPSSSFEMRIISVSPLSGGYNTTVTINGDNFTDDIGAIVIKVNGVQATVLSATKYLITFSIPLGAGNGPITITLNGKTISGPSFTYVSSMIVSTFAGNGLGEFLNGASTISTINNPVGLAFDVSGNLYVAEYNRIKKITPSGTMSIVAGSGVRGYWNATGESAMFSPVNDIDVDLQGNIYVADRDNSCIRKVTPSGIVSTFAGQPGYGYVDGTADIAKFWQPVAVAVDKDGNVFVADESNNRVRKITPLGVVSTLAGNGLSGFKDGPALQAQFYGLSGICVDGWGNVYVSEKVNNRIRKISPDGNVTTLAGSGSSNYRNGIGVQAEFASPNGIAVDNGGTIYVADLTNALIRKITTSGVVTTVAGVPVKQGYLDGPANAAMFYYPQDVAVNSKGEIFVADRPNNRIRKIANQ